VRPRFTIANAARNPVRYISLVVNTSIAGIAETSDATANMKAQIEHGGQANILVRQHAANSGGFACANRLDTELADQRSPAQYQI
jgi:hypothetical protein